MGKTKQGKGKKLMVMQTLLVFHSPAHGDSAGPHEVTLAQATLNEIVTVGRPRRLIGDRAYGSDPLDNALAVQGIEMGAPHGAIENVKQCRMGALYDITAAVGKLGAFFVWLNAFKRTRARWDRFHENFTAFVYLASSMILPRRIIRE